MTNRPTLECLAVLLWSYIVCFAIGAAAESPISVPVDILSGFDGSPVWVGVVVDDGTDRSIQWSSVETRQFSIEVFESSGNLIFFALKRNSVPVVKLLTSDSISDGITIEFSDGASVSGTVVSVKGSSPISEGLVTVRFDETLDIPLPEDNPVFAWELEEDGTFEIHGLPLGTHTVSVLAPGCMPAAQQIQVEEITDRPLELIFSLAKAVHARGRIVDWTYQATVDGTLEVVVMPLESQTTEVETEFDNDGSFRLGPFAEDAVVEIVARTAHGLRSRPIEVVVPADDIEIEVFQWIRVLGTVQDRDTGDPIPRFSLITGRLYENVTAISDSKGQFDVEISDDVYFLFVCILASGYSFWVSELIHVEGTDELKVDLGVIELEPTVSVRGRVLDQDTRNPIEGATIYQDDSRLGTRARAIQISSWTSWNVRTTTDAEGEFQLDGLSATASAIRVGAAGYSGVSQTIEDFSQPLEIELKPSGSISGQVISLSGEPVAARISYSGGSIRSDDGSFRFVRPAGTYRYKAYAESGTSKVVEVTLETGESVEGVRLVIEVIGRVSGTVSGLLDEETAQVWVEGIGGGIIEYGVTNGAFELTGVPQGHHVVGSKTSLGREQQGTVVIDESMVGRVELVYSGSSTLSGRLIASARGLVDHKIRAVPEDSTLPVVQTRTVRDGSYRLEGLVNGNYQLEVPMHDFVQQVVVQGDTYSDLHVQANRLSGKVLGSGSMEGAEVRLIGGIEGEKISLWTKVRANGSYLFKGVPSGTYTIQITHPDYAEVSQQVDVYEERVKVDLQIDEMNNEFED